MNPGKMNTKIDRKLRVMAVCYVLLAALEDIETQRRGFCILVNPKTVTIRQVTPCRWLSVTHLYCFRVKQETREPLTQPPSSGFLTSDICLH